MLINYLMATSNCFTGYKAKKGKIKRDNINFKNIIHFSINVGQTTK